MLPPLPPEASPVDRERPPEDPVLVVPVDTRMAPLSPLAPAFAVLMATWPDVPERLGPLLSSTAPPVARS